MARAPLFDLPDLSVPQRTRLLVKTIELPKLMPVDPWVQCANTPDIQHIKTLHRVKFDSDPYDFMRWDRFSMQYEFEGFFDSGARVEMARRHLGHVAVLPECVSRRPLVRIHGADGHAAAGSIAQLHGHRGTSDRRPRGRRSVHRSLHAHRDGHRRRRHARDEHDAFSPGHVDAIRSRCLGKYFTYLRDYPRAHPSAPFIKCEPAARARAARGSAATPRRRRVALFRLAESGADAARWLLRRRRVRRPTSRPWRVANHRSRRRATAMARRCGKFWSRSDSD